MCFPYFVTIKGIMIVILDIFISYLNIDILRIVMRRDQIYNSISHIVKVLNKSYNFVS